MLGRLAIRYPDVPIAAAPAALVEWRGGCPHGHAHSRQRLRQSWAAMVRNAPMHHGLNANRSPFESPTTTIVPAIAGELKTAECVS